MLIIYRMGVICGLNPEPPSPDRYSNPRSYSSR